MPSLELTTHPPIRKSCERQITECILDQPDVDPIGTSSCRREPGEFRRRLVRGDDRHQRAGAGLSDAAVGFVVGVDEFRRSWLRMDGEDRHAKRSSGP